MERQLAEKEEKQAREIANIKSRETAEIQKVSHEERLKAEKARIATDEEVQVAEENKNRQIIVAQKNKDRTLAVETERVEKDRELEVNERQRIVTLAQIEKEKSIEVERKNIQEVIRERIAIEKTVVDEEEKIKDTKAFAEADRSKSVAITNAEQKAEEQLVQQIKASEAGQQAARGCQSLRPLANLEYRSRRNSRARQSDGAGECDHCFCREPQGISRRSCA